LVIDGANLDESLSFAAELMLDDVYELGKSIEPVRLALHAVSEIKFTVAEGTKIGAVSSALHLDSASTFMSPDGQITDTLILVEVDDEVDIDEVYLLPLSPLAAHTSYSLVGINTKTPAHTFAQVACVSFSRGTHITLASGDQRRIEELNVGDRVLTRDDGPKKSTMDRTEHCSGRGRIYPDLHQGRYT
jgi:hypothetical protein